MSGVKRCTGCDKDLPHDNFGVKTHRKDGSPVFLTRCRRCRSTQQYAATLRRQAMREDGLACPVDAEIPIRLPIGPWRDWLVARLAAPEMEHGLLSDRLGVDQRQLARWLLESTKIKLDTIDAALCKLGDPGLLRDLYPELYSFDGDDADDEAVAA